MARRRKIYFSKKQILALLDAIDHIWTNFETADQEYIDETDEKSLRAAEKKLRAYKFWRK